MLTLTNEPEVSDKLYPAKGEFTYASGPFNVKTARAPEPILGVDLMQSGNAVTVWDGGSGLSFDSDSYDASVSKDGETVTFTNKEDEEGTVVITPASYDDLKNAYSYLKFSSEEEAIRVVRGLIRQVAGSAYGVYTGGKLTDLGLVVEDNADNVLGLYVINKDGTFKRENGAWVAIDPEDDQANDEIESGIWMQVLDGAKQVYDEKENNDQLTVADFDGYSL